MIHPSEISLHLPTMGKHLKFSFLLFRNIDPSIQQDFRIQLGRPAVRGIGVEALDRGRFLHQGFKHLDPHHPVMLVGSADLDMQQMAHGIDAEMPFAPLYFFGSIKISVGKERDG